MLTRLVGKLPKTSNQAKQLDVPYSVMLLKKCAKFGIDGAVVKSLHIIDLTALIISFEVSEIRAFLEQQRAQKLREKGISEVRRIDGNEALKLFKR